MTIKSKFVIDRRSVYLPKPNDWDWHKIDVGVVEERLKLARGSRDKMMRWRADIETERDELWAELRDRLTEAKMYETQTRLAHVEDCGKQMRQVDRLLKQLDESIGVIERRMGVKYRRK